MNFFSHCNLKVGTNEENFVRQTDAIQTGNDAGGSILILQLFNTVVSEQI